MGRKQIRVYVEDDVWKQIKADTGLSTDSDVMDHVMATYLATDALKVIHPDPAVAVGMAITSHQIINQIQWQGTVTAVMPTVETESTTPSPQLLKPLDSSGPIPEDTLSLDNASDW